MHSWKCVPESQKLTSRMCISLSREPYALASGILREGVAPRRLWLALSAHEVVFWQRVDAHVEAMP